MCARLAKWQPFLAKAKHQDRGGDGINIYKAHITVNLSLSAQYTPRTSTILLVRVC